MELYLVIILSFLEITFIIVGILLLHFTRRRIGQAAFYITLGALFVFIQFISVTQLKVIVGYHGADFYIANSIGVAVDVAGSYIHKESQFVASLIARNVGIQITRYDKGNSEPIPFEVQLGLSKGLKHLPFRFSVLFNHLNKWDLRYDDPIEERLDPITGEEQTKSWIEKSSDELLRHIVIGGEVTIAKFINVRIGYNYKRRKEMAVSERPSTVGISWGLGVRISKFHISYSRSRYHLQGSPNFITITTNLSDFVKAN